MPAMEGSFHLLEVYDWWMGEYGNSCLSYFFNMRVSLWYLYIFWGSDMLKVDELLDFINDSWKWNQKQRGSHFPFLEFHFIWKASRDRGLPSLSSRPKCLPQLSMCQVKIRSQISLHVSCMGDGYMSHHLLPPGYTLAESWNGKWHSYMECGQPDWCLNPYTKCPAQKPCFQWQSYTIGTPFWSEIHLIKICGWTV